MGSQRNQRERELGWRAAAGGRRPESGLRRAQLQPLGSKLLALPLHEPFFFDGESEAFSLDRRRLHALGLDGCRAVDRPRARHLRR